MEINYISSDAVNEFKAAVRPVWQYYIDLDYFTWEDIDAIERSSE